MNLVKIISGGQTGADRAALDWAIKNGIEHGGWCPKGRKAEDGVISAQYDLKEASRSDYWQRTELNVIDSDGTVIFTMKKKLSRGSKRTAESATGQGKPVLHLSGVQREAAADLLKAFLQQNNIRVLNVAGSRGSKEPEIADFVMMTLSQALDKLNYRETGVSNATVSRE